MPSAPPGFAECDVEPQDAGLVLPFEGDEVAAGVENRDGERRATRLSGLLEGAVHDGAGLREINGHEQLLM
jgi:hypothetical protein